MCRALARHRAEQLVERVGEQLHAFLDQLCRHRVDRDAGPIQRRHRLLGLVDILLEARPHLPVIAERIHRRRRNGVDRVGSDQLLDIEHVAVVLVLGAGARPKQPLHPRALGAAASPSARRRTAACSV